MSYEYADGYQIRNQGATHYLTFTVEGWVDLLSRKVYKDILLNSFSYCRKNKNLQIHAFVFMTNHIHTIWTAKDNNLSDIVRDFKTHTSKSFVKIINELPESRRAWLLYKFKFFARKSSANKIYKIWTNDNHPEEIVTQDFFYQKLNYIHENPVRAGIVHDGIDYIYSSATNYADKKSIFDPPRRRFFMVAMSSLLKAKKYSSEARTLRRTDNFIEQKLNYIHMNPCVCNPPSGASNYLHLNSKTPAGAGVF